MPKQLGRNDSIRESHCCSWKIGAALPLQNTSEWRAPGVPSGRRDGGPIRDCRLSACQRSPSSRTPEMINKEQLVSGATNSEPPAAVANGDKYLLAWSDAGGIWFTQCA